MSFTSANFRAGFSVRGMFLLVLLSFAALALAAETAGAGSIDTFQLIMRLFGGLALFLFGIDQMSDGLKAVAGDRMAALLGTMTRNRFIGAITGAFVTALLNSSSVTTVLVVGFTTAGIMTLQQSIGVIMGANVGSTFTAQIVAFNVTQYALALVAVGFTMQFTARRDQVRHYGASAKSTITDRTSLTPARSGPTIVLSYTLGSTHQVPADARCRNPSCALGPRVRAPGRRR